jgi:hypothetical protein
VKSETSSTIINAESVSSPRKRTKPGDQRPELRLARDAGEPLVQRLFARHEPVARGEVVDERQLGVDLLEALRGQPLPVRLRPRLAVVHAPVAQQQLGDPVATAHQIGPDLLARPCEIPGRLERGRRHRDRGQRTGHQLAQQQVGVAAV